MPSSTNTGVAPDVLFAQKASAVAKCAGMDPRSMDLERFRALAPMIFSKAYATIYKEKLPLSVENEPEECMQYVIEGLLDKTSVGALTLITGVDVCSGSHRAIGVLVGVLFAEGQRMWLLKQEAKAKTEAMRNDAAGVPNANTATSKRPQSASATRSTPSKSATPAAPTLLPTVPGAGARPSSAAPSRGSRNTAPANHSAGTDDNEPTYGDDFVAETEVATAGAVEGNELDGSAEKKRKGKKGKRKSKQVAEQPEEAGVGLEEGLDEFPKAPQSPEEVNQLMKRVAYLEGRLKKKKSGSPKRKKKVVNAEAAEDSSKSAGVSSPTSKKNLGQPVRVASRPTSAPSARSNARKLQLSVATGMDPDAAGANPFVGPDGERHPANHFTYDMKSGRRVLLSADEIDARERRKELYLLGAAKEVDLPAGSEDGHDNMPRAPGQMQPRPPLAPYSPPPAEPTKPTWPGPSTGHATDNWIKKQRAARDLEAREAEARAAAVAEYNRPRIYPAYSKLGTNDMVISIEHCVNCHCHNVTLRHQPREYIGNADAFLVAVAHIAHDLHVGCRVGVTRFPADITSKSKETDANSRVGAFEIQVAFRGADGSVHAELLHSKLSTRRWPSKQVVEKRLRAFCSKHNVPTFYIPQDSIDTQDYADSVENTRGDGSTYPVGAGPWESVNLAGVGAWQFRSSDYDGLHESAVAPRVPGRKHTGPVTTRTARPPTATVDNTPNASNTASLDTVHWAWDSRGFKVIPKFAVGDIVYVRDLVTIKCAPEAVRTGLGYASSRANSEWLARSPMGVSGRPRQASERYPLLAEVVNMGSGTDEQITVRPKYFSHINVSCKQSQCTLAMNLRSEDLELLTYEAGNDKEQRVKQDTNIPLPLAAVLVLCLMARARVEPTSTDALNAGSVPTLPEAKNATLEWVSYDSSDRTSADVVCRQRHAVFHALRDAVSLLLAKYEPSHSAGELDGERSDILAGLDANVGELRHPMLPDVYFQPCLAYSERSLDWLETHCRSESGGINVRKAESLALASCRTMQTTDSTIFAPTVVIEAAVSSDITVGDMVDPAEMGAMAVRATEKGLSFDVVQSTSPNPASTMATSSSVNVAAAAAAIAAIAADMRSDPDEDDFTRPMAADDIEQEEVAVSSSGAQLKGTLDPMLANFLDGLDDDEDDGADGEEEDNYDDDDYA